MCLILKLILNILHPTMHHILLTMQHRIHLLAVVILLRTVVILLRTVVILLNRMLDIRQPPLINKIQPVLHIKDPILLHQDHILHLKQHTIMVTMKEVWWQEQLLQAPLCSVESRILLVEARNIEDTLETIIMEEVILETISKEVIIMGARQTWVMCSRLGRE